MDNTFFILLVTMLAVGRFVEWITKRNLNEKDSQMLEGIIRKYRMVNYCLILFAAFLILVPEIRYNEYFLLNVGIVVALFGLVLLFQLKKIKSIVSSKKVISRYTYSIISKYILIVIFLTIIQII